MTFTEDECPSTGSFYSIKKTEDRGRAVYACRFIPSGSTILIASEPFVSVIKEKFKREVCAWCFKYQHGKYCPVRHPETRTGVNFCSIGCLQDWTQRDLGGKLAEVLASLRTNGARKVIAPKCIEFDMKYASAIDEFPLDQTKLVASAIVQRSRSNEKPLDRLVWDDVLQLQPGVFDDEIDLPSEVKQITPFLKLYLPQEFAPLIESTAYPFLSRHLSNSFGVWELPISPDSEHLGSVMYPSASYFNHSCDPNVAKVRQGRIVLFVTSKDVQPGEELCISYGHTERQVLERRQVLRDWWGFTCNCSRCSQELESLEI